MKDGPERNEKKISDNKIITEMLNEDLVKIKMIQNEGLTLYRHKTTNAYWEKYYPFPAYHGDGPPELRRVPSEYAKEKYGIEQ